MPKPPSPAIPYSSPLTPIRGPECKIRNITADPWRFRLTLAEILTVGLRLPQNDTAEKSTSGGKKQSAGFGPT